MFLFVLINSSLALEDYTNTTTTLRLSNSPTTTTSDDNENALSALDILATLCKSPAMSSNVIPLLYANSNVSRVNASCLRLLVDGYANAANNDEEPLSCLKNDHGR